MNYTGNSITDYLNSIGQDSSFSARKELARKEGNVNYAGSANDNTSLLSTLRSRTSPTPTTSTANANIGLAGQTGQATGVIGTASYEPNDGGAAGKFYNLTPAQVEEQIRADNEAIKYGVPLSESGDFQLDPNYTIPKEPVFSDIDSKKLSKQYGFGNSDEYAGLTRSQAQAKAQAKAQAVGQQVNANTSYTFNPEATSGAKKILDNFSFKLNENNTDPFRGKGSKNDQLKGILESTANEFAKLFTDQETFNAQLKNNAQFQQAIEAFTKQGGDINSITSRIAKPATALEVVSYTDNPDGTTTNTLSDGSKSTVQYIKNPDGTLTPKEIRTEQNTADYLRALSPNATPAEKEAYNSLIPEKELAQSQISHIAGIPKEYTDLYFGTPEKIGLIQEKRIQAEEYIKIVTTKAENAKEDARTQANLAVEKNNLDLEIAQSQIEENRLKSKNYMTGMLAKMGALNTTGTAVLSLGVLDQKYKLQAQQLKAKVLYANKVTQSKLTETVHDLETDKEEKIYKLQTDLTKDRETVLKEIFKVEQSSAKDIFSVMSKYTTALRVQSDKYTATAKREAAAYAKAYAKTASKGRVSTSSGSRRTGSGSGFTSFERKTLQAGGLLTNNRSVQDFFLRGTEPAFRQAWTRNVQIGENKNPTIQNITNSYNQWKGQNKSTPTNTTTKTSKREI